VANPHESLGEDVQEESALELDGGQRHDPWLAAVGIILPSEGNSLSIKRQQPVIGDRHPMGIPAQVPQDLGGAAPGRLRVDNPVLFIQRAEKATELAGVGECGSRSCTAQLMAAIETLEPRQELTPKDTAEHLGLAPPDDSPSAVSKGRARLSAADGLFWVWLTRLWSAWRSALIIVDPEAVIACHRRGFRL
jgi:hypothetical protein